MMFEEDDEDMMDQDDDEDLEEEWAQNPLEHDPRRMGGDAL